MTSNDTSKRVRPLNHDWEGLILYGVSHVRVRHQHKFMF